MRNASRRSKSTRRSDLTDPQGHGAAASRYGAPHKGRYRVPCPAQWSRFWASTSSGSHLVNQQLKSACGTASIGLGRSRLPVAVLRLWVGS